MWLLWLGESFSPFQQVGIASAIPTKSQFCRGKNSCPSQEEQLSPLFLKLQHSVNMETAFGQSSSTPQALGHSAPTPQDPGSLLAAIILNPAGNGSTPGETLLSHL
mmetsp:Transcript_26927/g.45829  ORF Transcript_26927/g.45829 Transcript_26927/m.45829 type:complete len:106 (+) Transcript_26927:692-1009(+)